MKCDALHKSYSDFIPEISNMGHLKKIAADEINNSYMEVHYLPYPHVVKESSTTTKFRVVFAGSSETEEGPSFIETPVMELNWQDD